ncbi:MAG TPA: hypothetical protein VLJ16_06605 [Acidobacteriota bacterium]|nr:hypothetical protein [Acidobacteriota bacterium]
MKLRTRLGILVVAALLSLAGFGLIANGLSADRIMSAATPATEVGVTIVG